MSTQNKELELGPVRECQELARLLGHDPPKYKDDTEIIECVRELELGPVRECQELARLLGY